MATKKKRPAASTRRSAPRRRQATGNRRVGSRFDEFLESAGLRSAATSVALKRVIAWQVAEEMKRQEISKQRMARRMETSRSALDRLLDPEITALSIKTLDKAARALGKRVLFELIDG